MWPFNFWSEQPPAENTPTEMTPLLSQPPPEVTPPEVPVDIFAYLKNDKPKVYEVPLNVQHYMNMMVNYEEKIPCFLPIRNGSSRYVAVSKLGDFSNGSTEKNDTADHLISDYVKFLNEKCKYYCLSKFRSDFQDFFGFMLKRRGYIETFLSVEIFNKDGTLSVVPFNFDGRAIINKFIFDEYPPGSLTRRDQFTKTQSTNSSILIHSRLTLEASSRGNDLWYLYEKTPYQYMYFASDDIFDYAPSVYEKFHKRSICLDSNAYTWSDWGIGELVTKNMYLDESINIDLISDEWHSRLEKNNCIVPYATQNGVVYIFWNQYGIVDKYGAKPEEFAKQGEMIWKFKSQSPLNGKYYLTFNFDSYLNWGDRQLRDRESCDPGFHMNDNDSRDSREICVRHVTPKPEFVWTIFKRPTGRLF